MSIFIKHHIVVFSDMKMCSGHRLKIISLL